MTLIRILLPLLIIVASNTNAQTTIVVRDSLTHEPLIFAPIYSFQRDTCFDNSGFNGIISLPDLDQNDTLFQIEYVGFLPTTFSDSEIDDTLYIELLDLGRISEIYGGGISTREYEYFEISRRLSKCK